MLNSEFKTTINKDLSKLKKSKLQKINQDCVQLKKEYEARIIIFCETFLEEEKAQLKALHNKIERVFDFVHIYSEELQLENKKDFMLKIHKVAESEKALREVRRIATGQANLAIEEGSLYYKVDIKKRFKELLSLDSVTRNNLLMLQHKAQFKDLKFIFANIHASYKFKIQNLC